MTPLQDIFPTVEPYIDPGFSPNHGASKIERCKYLAKVIKAQRTPTWPLPDVSTADLPPKDIADALIGCYLDTIETIYRIFHLPSFTHAYDAVWDQSGGPPNVAFVIQLKLVLAIGATVYDDRFSWRSSAIRWVYEALTWLSQPVYKSRLSLEFLQTQLLCMLAREVVGVGGELVWISAGSVFRTAVHMGLHRDPTRVSTLMAGPLTAEMRRRLWNTVLEIGLQLSLDSGGIPFISLDDFDAAPPGNFDDDQLTVDAPVEKPDHIFTQTSVAVQLRKSFAIRLKVTKFLNGIHSAANYEETLRLDEELRQSYTDLRQSLHSYERNGVKYKLSTFERGTLDVIMSRYLSALHMPLFRSSLSGQKATYAFSRKTILEMSLQICGVMNPSSSHPGSLNQGQSYLSRLAICASGFFRTAVFQTAFVLAAELRGQLREDRLLSLSQVPRCRPDLLAVIERAQALTLRCLEAGETNIKNHFLICLAAAEIDALNRGIPEDECPALLVKSAQDTLARCLGILESNAPHNPEGMEPSEYMDNLRQPSYSNTAATPMGDFWDFMIPESLFDFRTSDQAILYAINDPPMRSSERPAL